MIAAHSASFHTQVQDQERVRMTFENFLVWNRSPVGRVKRHRKPRITRLQPREETLFAHSTCFGYCEYRDPTEGDREELNQQCMCGF